MTTTTENHNTNIDSLTHYVARHEWTGEPILETTPDGTPFWKCNRALERVATCLLDELERDYTPEEISEAWNDERETRENARFWAEESSMGW